MARQRNYGKVSTDGRVIYVALIELADLQGHVISPGELFTQTKAPKDDRYNRQGFWPVCADCRPFKIKDAVA